MPFNIVLSEVKWKNIHLNLVTCQHTVFLKLTHLYNNNYNNKDFINEGAY